jgi:hypothetical protein
MGIIHDVISDLSKHHGRCSVLETNLNVCALIVNQEKRLGRSMSTFTGIAGLLRLVGISIHTNDTVIDEHADIPKLKRFMIHMVPSSAIEATFAAIRNTIGENIVNLVKAYLPKC